MQSAERCNAGYARVAAVAGAFTDPETALALYLAAFVCDELVRACCLRGASGCARAWERGALMRRCGA
jgi:hypothetical protein